MTSVADELALDNLLDSLSPLNRISIERAMKSRFVDRTAISDAYDEGFEDGVEKERARARRAADEAKAKESAPSNDQNPPAAAAS